MSGWLQNCFLHVCDNSNIVCACRGTWSVGYFGTILSQLPLETICAVKSFIPSTVLSWQSHTSAHLEEKIYIKSLRGSSPSTGRSCLVCAQGVGTIQYHLLWFYQTSRKAGNFHFPPQRPDLLSFKSSDLCIPFHPLVHRSFYNHRLI